MKRNLRAIVIFSPVTYPFKSGAGINALNLAKEYVKQGYKVKIVSFRSKNLPLKEFRDGIEIVRIPVSNSNIIFKVLSFATILPVFLYYMLRTDLSIIFGPMQGFVFLFIVGKLVKKKVLFRSTMLKVDDVISLNNKYGNYFYFIRRYLIGLMGGYISQSPAMTERLIKEYGNTIPFLESAQGVNTEIFKPISIKDKNKLKLSENISAQTKVIISVGYVIERKGYREIIDCLSQLKNKEFIYIIIGNYNPTKEHYLYYAKNEMLSIYTYGKEKLKDKVLFLGECNDVSKYLKMSDVFILNSNKEGMPNVLLEAMATGLPVIVKSLEGVDNYITKNSINALVINRQQTLSSALKQLFIDKKLGNKLGNNAQTFIRNNYSLKVVAKKIIDNFS